MKRNANAAAHSSAQGKLKQAVKAVKKAVKATPKMAGDTNALSAADLDIISKIDARLHDLYYLNDEESYLGI